MTTSAAETARIISMDASIPPTEAIYGRVNGHEGVDKPTG